MMRFSDQFRIPRWVFWLVIGLAAVLLFVVCYVIAVNAPIPRKQFQMRDQHPH
jgi:hypothetical protein